MFTIKQLKWAIAACECALIVSRVFGAALKSVLPVVGVLVCLLFCFVCVFCFVFVPLIFFSIDN